MAFITVDSPDDNIWEKNTSLELISEFRDFKEKEGIDKSSNILKAIYYIWDPKSDIRDSGVSEKKLIEDVTTDLIKDPDFKWDDYDHIRKAYMDNNITLLEGKLLNHEAEMAKLKKFLDDWVLDKNDIRDRILAVSAYTKLIDEYIDIRDKVKMETEELSDMLGGYQKSMIEDLGDRE